MDAERPPDEEEDAKLLCETNDCFGGETFPPASFSTFVTTGGGGGGGGG